MVYLVHGFEGGKQQLVTGTQGNVVEKCTGFVKLTMKSFYVLCVERSTALWMQVSDQVTKLIAKLTEKSTAAPAAPKDGLVVTKEQAKKQPVAASSPTVTVAKPAQESDAEKTARRYEERKKAVEADEARAAAETQKAANVAQASREAEENRQREQKRKDDAQRQAAAASEEREKTKRDEQEEKIRLEAKKAKKAAKKAAKEQKAKEEEAAKKLSEEKAAEQAAAEPAAQQAAPKEQQPKATEPTDTAKIMQEHCDQFDVYDCDVKYPKLFDACRNKKTACDTVEDHEKGREA